MVYELAYLSCTVFNKIEIITFDDDNWLNLTKQIVKVDGMLKK